MKVGVVDIGTNSMRLLVMEDGVEIGRWVEVTGLGVGVDATGRLSDDAMARTLEALTGFGGTMDDERVVRRKAIATSASRDAANREHFFDLAEKAMGVRPTLISGTGEATLAYRGATAGADFPQPVLVVDIGGGSTEFVTNQGMISVDIGSVRLTERHLPDRPATSDQLTRARQVVSEMFDSVDVGPHATLVGVAGTWTSLAAVALDLPSYDREKVHQSHMTSTEVTGLVERLSAMTVDETAAVPSMDPKRAPVILAGAVVAEAAVLTSPTGEVIVSEHDTLDAVAAELAQAPQD